MTDIETTVGAETVRVVDCETVPRVAEIVVLPAASPLTSPVALTVAVACVEELQATVAVKSALLPSL